MENTKYHKQFHALLSRDGSVRTHQLFTDFCRTAAIALQQPFLNSEKLEEEYMSIIRKYKKETVHTFPELLATIIMAFEDNPHQDFLGAVYSEAEFYNARTGQFFTPYHLSRMTVDMVLGNLSHQLQTKTFITIAEPAAGAGSMLIAARNVFVQQQRNLNTELWCSATDIDRLCADMCYIQLSLLGVAAEVNWGNTLSMELWNTMVTPIHSLHAWDVRLCGTIVHPIPAPSVTVQPLPTQLEVEQLHLF